jgi:hypothetical protein
MVGMGRAYGGSAPPPPIPGEPVSSWNDEPDRLPTQAARTTAAIMLMKIRRFM